MNGTLLALGSAAALALAAGTRSGSRAAAPPPPGPGWVGRFSFSIRFAGGLEVPKDKIAIGNRAALARQLRVREWRWSVDGSAFYRTEKVLVDPVRATGAVLVWTDRPSLEIGVWAEAARLAIGEAVEAFVADGPDGLDPAIPPELGPVQIIPRIGGITPVKVGSRALAAPQGAPVARLVEIPRGTTLYHGTTAAFEGLPRASGPRPAWFAPDRKEAIFYASPSWKADADKPQTGTPRLVVATTTRPVRVLLAWSYRHFPIARLDEASLVEAVRAAGAEGWAIGYDVDRIAGLALLGTHGLAVARTQDVAGSVARTVPGTPRVRPGTLIARTRPSALSRPIPASRLVPAGKDAWTYTGPDGTIAARIRVRGKAAEIWDWRGPLWRDGQASILAALRELKAAWPGTLAVAGISVDPDDVGHWMWVHLFGRGFVDRVRLEDGRDAVRRVAPADPLRWWGPKRDPGEARGARYEAEGGSGAGAEEEPLFDAVLAAGGAWRVDPKVVRYRVARDHPDGRKALAGLRETWREYLREGHYAGRFDPLQLAWEQGLQEKVPPITIFQTGRIFDGWHRTAAALGHGVDEVPAIVIRWDEAGSAALALWRSPPPGPGWVYPFRFEVPLSGGEERWTPERRAQLQALLAWPDWEIIAGYADLKAAFGARSVGVTSTGVRVAIDLWTSREVGPKKANKIVQHVRDNLRWSVESEIVGGIRWEEAALIPRIGARPVTG